MDRQSVGYDDGIWHQILPLEDCSTHRQQCLAIPKQNTAVWRPQMTPMLLASCMDRIRLCCQHIVLVYRL